MSVEFSNLHNTVASVVNNFHSSKTSWTFKPRALCLAFPFSIFPCPEHVCISFKSPLSDSSYSVCVFLYKG